MSSNNPQGQNQHTDNNDSQRKNQGSRQAEQSNDPSGNRQQGQNDPSGSSGNQGSREQHGDSPASKEQGTTHAGQRQSSGTGARSCGTGTSAARPAPHQTGPGGGHGTQAPVRGSPLPGQRQTQRVLYPGHWR